MHGSLKRARHERYRLLVASEADVRDAALAAGLAFSSRVVTSGSSESLHWLYDADGRRVLEWWPVAGTWYSPVTLERGLVLDPARALRLARHFAVRACSEGLQGKGADAPAPPGPFREGVP